MPRTATLRRHKPSAPTTPAQPPTEPPAPGQAAAAASVPSAGAALWVGGYEVGEVFCPQLYGHPDILY